MGEGHIPLATGHYPLHGHNVRVEYGIIRTEFVKILASTKKVVKKIGTVTRDQTRDVRFVRQQFYHSINKAHTGVQHILSI